MSNFLNNTTDLEKILDTLNNGKYVDTADATATANDIANGKTAYVNGENIEGTYTAPTLAELTADADATAGDIVSGKTAYVDGVKITGTKVDKSLAELTADADAAAGDIMSGKKAYVDGNLITGTLVPAKGEFSQATGSFSMSSSSHSIKSVSSNAFLYGEIMNGTTKVGTLVISVVDSVATTLAGYALVTFTPSYSGTTLKLTQSKTQSLTVDYTVYNVV